MIIHLSSWCGRQGLQGGGLWQHLIEAVIARSFIRQACVMIVTRLLTFGLVIHMKLCRNTSYRDCQLIRIKSQVAGKLNNNLFEGSPSVVQGIAFAVLHVTG